MIEVYYAEDDEIIAKSVKEYLEQQNCMVTVFRTIAEIRKALLSHLPAVILLDWNMPDGQGHELCRWIRDRWNDLPVIYLTVRGDSCDIVSGFQNGADDYVVKPFNLAVLHSRILALLRRAKGTKAVKLTCDDLILDKEASQNISFFCCFWKIRGKRSPEDNFWKRSGITAETMSMTIR